MIAKLTIIMLLIVIQVNCENTSIEKEKVLLNQSLKTLRKDYNELLENVDKLVKEFTDKFREAGNVPGFVPQITEQKLKPLPITSSQSSKPVEWLETTLNQDHRQIDNQTGLELAEDIDESSIKPQNKQITELTNKGIHKNENEERLSETEDKGDSFLSAKGPTKVHPLFTFRKGKPSQTSRNAEDHLVEDIPDN